MEKFKTDKSVNEIKVAMESKVVISGGISLSNSLIKRFKEIEANCIKNNYVLNDDVYNTIFMQYCFSHSKLNGLVECLISRTIIRTILESCTPFYKIKHVELVSKDDDYLIEWKVLFFHENETVH